MTWSVTLERLDDNEGAKEKKNNNKKKTSNSKTYDLYFSAIKFCFQTFQMFFFVLMTKHLLKHDFRNFSLASSCRSLPLTPIFQNTTFIHYVQRLANVTKIDKFIYYKHISLGASFVPI